MSPPCRRTRQALSTRRSLLSNIPSNFPPNFPRCKLDRITASPTATLVTTKTLRRTNSTTRLPLVTETQSWPPRSGPAPGPSSGPASGPSSAARENKAKEKRGGKQRRGGRERRAAREQNAGDMMDIDQDDDAVVVERVTATRVTNFAAAAIAITLGKEKQKENQQPRANQGNAFAAVDGRADKDKPKENVKPRGNQIEELSRRLAGIAVAPAAPSVSKKLETPSEEIDAEVVTDPSTVDPAVLAERAEHQKFMNAALDMARLALVTNETPVGCVLVHKGEIISKGMNATNVTRNGTRHAEFMAISALFSVPRSDGPRTTCLKPKVPPKVPEGKENDPAYSQEWRCPDEGNEDGSKGHLYPYGQKMILLERVPTDIMKECILYVTVEPCVMCASLLRQLCIKKVYYGAVNDKFGGCGGVFNIHANGLPPGSTDRVHPEPKRYLFPDGGGSLGVSYPLGGGHGSNVEPGFEIEGGWSRDEAVGLLRRFYVQENGRAPVPRKKEGRAARLAAMMEQQTTGAATSGGEVGAENTTNNGSADAMDVDMDADNTQSTPMGDAMDEDAT
ncbi:uncharacterized protein TrAtP1_002155 [Trichoderma atroviride]|nr:hypothetical protein TrAtP1_002155 [Trichoderma atroviride]